MKEKYLKTLLLLTALPFLSGCNYIKEYEVYSAQMDGKARYAEAVSSRQIKVLEAKAKQESAAFEAEAEITRAKGVAQANKIIGSSLKQNEDYLRYLWIDKIQEGKHEVIYVPTEAGLPILEAGKRQ
jgi:regulator of protease activity HflC (stomatin/prohibitin superfamily)